MSDECYSIVTVVRLESAPGAFQQELRVVFFQLGFRPETRTNPIEIPRTETQRNN
jgi:hypothetical protein